MAINLVSLAMKFLTPEVMQKLATGLGLDKMLAQKAIGAAVPAILAGLVGKSAKPDGARSILDVLGKQDTNLLGNLAGMIGGSAQSTLVNSGTNMLTSLLGGSTLGHLVGAVAKYAGIGETPARGLLGILGPIIMGTLGQEQKSGKLDAAGLASLLSDQKSNITAALPADFSKLLGGTGLIDAIREPGKSAAANATPSPARKVEMPVRAIEAPAAPWWRLPLLAAAALGLGWSLFSTTPPPGVLSPATTAPQLVVDGVDVGGVMTGTFDQLRATLGNIRDAASAQAAVPRLQETATQLDRVTALATRMPPAMRQSFAGTVANGTAALSPLLNSVLALPGVGAVAKPAIDALRARLDALAKG